MTATMLRRWLRACAVVLLAELISYPLAPLACALADRRTGRLPRLLWWMETPTVVLPGPRSITGIIAERYGFWVASVYWLWRNAAYGAADYFRVDPVFENATLQGRGDTRCNNDPYVPGWFFGWIDWLGNDNEFHRAFEFRAVWPMPAGRCGMIRVGWKLSAWFDGRRPEKPTATGMLQVISIRPFLSRK